MILASADLDLMPLTVAFLTFVFGIVVSLRFQRHYFIEQTLRQLAEAHIRRVDRVQHALRSATSGTAWGGDVVPEMYFPFKHWVELLPDGTFQVAGEIFHTNQTASIVARDERNVPRASVVCDGSCLTITSHGQLFRARFLEGEWKIETLSPNEIANT